MGDPYTSHDEESVILRDVSEPHHLVLKMSSQALPEYNRHPAIDIRRSGMRPQSGTVSVRAGNEFSGVISGTPRVPRFN